MNLDQFNALYNNSKETGRFYGAKSDVEAVCGCGKSVVTKKFNAEQNIRKNGQYICRSCSLTIRHQNNPFTEETKEKLSQGKLGLKYSEEHKRHISEGKKALYASVKGEELKRNLSLITARKHEEGAFNRKIRGYFSTKKAAKVLYFSSSYELRLLYLLDTDEEVVKIESQKAIEIHGRGRCIDVIATYQDGTCVIFEVKPKYNIENCKSQIDDIEEYSKQINVLFKIWSEEDSGLNSPQEISKWAINFLPEKQSEEIKNQIKSKNLEKSIKYYHSKIATDTVTIHCNFCDKDHTALRLTYDKNIARNGRYICEREGGHIAGSRPKLTLRKDNPYASDGKKQCVKCMEILLFEDFGSDKSRADGYASRCKKCRASKAKESYNIPNVPD